MTEWSRRDVLRALGLGTALPGLAFLPSCGGHTGLSAGMGGRTPEEVAELRELLRAVVSELSLRHDEASALATIVRRSRATVDANERSAAQRISAGLLLSVRNGPVSYGEATTDLRPAGVALAVKQLAARSPAVRGGQVSLGTPRDFRTGVRLDPRASNSGQWLGRLDEVFERARGLGGSRVVYRAAYLAVEDTETLFIGSSRDLAQRIVRTRAGVRLVAWTGSSPTVDESSTSGTMGLEALEQRPEDLEAAADRALSLLTARDAPTGEFAVVLDPTISALVARECLGRALDASTWDGRSRAQAAVGTALGPEEVSLIDDPTAPEAYGGYFFDDEGELAHPVSLLDHGVLQGPITDRRTAQILGIHRTANGRRQSPIHPVNPCPSNLGFPPGKAPVEELIAEVKDGLLAERGLAARVNLSTWQCVIRVLRGKQIQNGKLTGALYGNLYLQSDIPSLLRNVRGMSDSREWLALAEPIPTSAGGPHMLTRAGVCGG